jgi:aminoglycoside/choline kinase family phosphotransferase
LERAILTDSWLDEALVWVGGILRETAEDLKLIPLAGDASTRSYLRVTGKNFDSAILMAWRDAAENYLWLSIGSLLCEGGLPLPRVYASSEILGLNLIEDLGDMRLDRLAQASPQMKGTMYLKAAGTLAKWHCLALPKVESMREELATPYTASFAYDMEWSYFIKGLSLLGFPIKLTETLSSEGRSLCAMAIRSSEAFMEANGANSNSNNNNSGTVLIHRDFQSRNIMCYKDSAYVLDWQGARLGPFQYDLASFIWDPYADLEEPFQEEIIEAYVRECRFHGRKITDGKGFQESLSLIAILRLMQAIGAYAKLTITMGKDYGSFIPKASKNLATLCRQWLGSAFLETKAMLNDFEKFSGDLS